MYSAFIRTIFIITCVSEGFKWNILKGLEGHFGRIAQNNDLKYNKKST
jgi:hypothetical protein